MEAGNGVRCRYARRLRRLRALRVPLDQIAILIRPNEAPLREALAVHRARLEGEARRILAALRLIEGEEQLVTELTLDLKLVDEPAGRFARNAHLSIASSRGGQG